MRNITRINLSLSKIILVEEVNQVMTLTLIEDTLSDEEQLASTTVKCSWCGEIIRLDGEELALAMCPSCYARMLAEYERSMKTNPSDNCASDR